MEKVAGWFGHDYDDDTDIQLAGNASEMTERV